MTDYKIEGLDESERRHLGGRLASRIHKARLTQLEWWKSCMPAIRAFLRLRGVEPNDCPHLEEGILRCGLNGPFSADAYDQDDEGPYNLRCWHIWDNSGNYIAGPMTHIQAHRAEWALMWLWAVCHGADGRGQK
jgi:hypothetical protein